ncbi:MMPL family transporter [Nocardia sp. SYP-A9097]|uniref:MMPL family transporter n=1 Tax=Nocardia sp. SYP-A9097 TaxID=2663237 RepID=UPI00129B448C|nr:MMPL family transporter [Nocardia sp. SYP-A9097]MRH93625.1 MMPL family transporter [Nocardia sp. SYP-A9097]
MITPIVTRDHPSVARPGPLGRLAGSAFRHRGRVVLIWALAAVIVTGLSLAYKGDFSADYSVPGSNSKHAQQLLSEQFPGQAGDLISVAVHSTDPVTDPRTRTDITALLSTLRGLPHVASVDDPFRTPGGITADGRSLVARLHVDVTNPVDMPVADTDRLLSAARAAVRPGLEIALGGQSIEMAEGRTVSADGIALVAALLILMVTFGTIVAAGLPVLVAIAGLAVSAMLTGVIAHVIHVADWAASLATMMLIALGIDYVLLMVTRFREWRAVGLDPERATVATLDTAGRSVFVAGGSVLVSMLGLFFTGLSFMRGAAVVSIVAVLIIVAAALTLFPALLGYFGPRIDRFRVTFGRRRAEPAAGGHIVPGRAWMRWGGVVERHSIVAGLAGTAILLLLAAPFLGVRFGAPDAGNRQQGTSARQAYDLLAAGFGPGSNAPLQVAIRVDQGDPAALERLTSGLRGTSGVAAVLPPSLSASGAAALLTVIPTTTPQDRATETLVHTLRHDVIPAAGADAYVGGVTATSIDATAHVTHRVPLLAASVIAISTVVLLLAFRSIAIPLTAAVLNLLSIAAAYGVMAFVLRGGWAGRLVGIDTATPLPAFVLVLVFAILFGLSMDYEVFLISRMRESWLRTRDNGRAIVDGLAGTGRVITAAAAVMVAVFASFVPSHEIPVKVMGVGMGAAILIDATVVRMLLVPAVMHLLGRVNWWLPSGIDRRLPHLHVEGRPDIHLRSR